jgi:hypothetical protein
MRKHYSIDFVGNVRKEFFFFSIGLAETLAQQFIAKTVSQSHAAVANTIQELQNQINILQAHFGSVPATV